MKTTKDRHYGDFIGKYSKDCLEDVSYFGAESRHSKGSSWNWSRL